MYIYNEVSEVSVHFALFVRQSKEMFFVCSHSTAESGIMWGLVDLVSLKGVSNLIFYIIAQFSIVRVRTTHIRPQYIRQN